MIVLVHINREIPRENVEIKVTQVCLVDPVLLGWRENRVWSLGVSKASLVYPVTTALQAIMEFQEHLAAQVRGS